MDSFKDPLPMAILALWVCRNVCINSLRSLGTAGEGKGEDKNVAYRYSSISAKCTSVPEF